MKKTIRALGTVSLIGLCGLLSHTDSLAQVSWPQSVAQAGSQRGGSASAKPLPADALLAKIADEYAKPADDTWGVVFSPDVSRVAYCARKSGEMFVVLDGGKGPSFDAVHRPVFSRDGRRLAYGATAGNKELVMVGDQRGPTFDNVGRPVFSPNGRTVAYRAKDLGHMKAKKPLVMVVNGKRVGTYTMVDEPAFSPKGETVYVAHPLGFHITKTGEYGMGTMRLMVNEREVAEHEGIQDPAYSADGKQLAYVSITGLGRDNMQSRVVVGTREEAAFREARFPAFSPDGTILAYVASRSQGRWFVVVGQKRGPEFDEIRRPVVGNGGDVAYPARTGSSWSMVSGRDVELPTVGPAFTQVGNPVMEPGSGTVAYMANSGKRWQIVCGSRRSSWYDDVGDPVFGDDGNVLVYGAQQGRELWRKTMRLTNQAVVPTRPAADQGEP